MNVKISNIATSVGTLDGTERLELYKPSQAGVDLYGTTAMLLARANHTGEIAISVVTGLQAALDLKAPLASPAFTGTPTVPTAAPGTNTTQAASTEFVTAAVAAGGSGVLNNYAATAAPTVDDDSTAGYAVGSEWIDVTNDASYRCLDATEGAAIWVPESFSLSAAYSLPEDIGTEGQVLVAPASGTQLEWANQTADPAPAADIVADLDAHFGSTDWRDATGGAGDVSKDGTPVANRVPYWTDASTIGHLAGFTFDPVTGTLTVPKLTVIDDQLADPNATALSGWDNAAKATIYYTLGSGLERNDNTIRVPAATTIAPGIVEFAIPSEINTGTDTGRAISPDSLAGSNFGVKEAPFMIVKSDTSVAVADGKEGLTIPGSMNGMNLIGVIAGVHTQGVTGSTTVQVRRRRAGIGADMLSTPVSLGAVFNASNGVINTSTDDIQTGDIVYVDVKAVHTTPPLGLYVTLLFQIP